MRYHRPSFTRYLPAIAVLAVAASACSLGTSQAAGSQAAGVEARLVAQAGPVVETSMTGISVAGTGDVFGTPDTLTVDLGISVLRPTVSEATSRATELATVLLATLTQQGIAEQDIQTSNYSIYPEYDYSNEQQRIIGYRVANMLTVKVRDLDKAGAIIDAAAAAGGNDVVVQGVWFSLEDNAAMVAEARKAAWEDTLGKAQQLAELAGVTLGSPISISESFSPTVPPVFYTETQARGDAAAAPIQEGQLSVQVTLQVQFAIGG